MRQEALVCLGDAGCEGVPPGFTPVPVAPDLRDAGGTRVPVRPPMPVEAGRETTRGPDGEIVETDTACTEDAGPGDAAIGVACDGCPLGFDTCEGACISVAYDPLNCGGCDISCGGSVCDFGQCRDATGWQQRLQIDAGITASVTDPRITADAAGNVLVAWTQRDDGLYRDVWANRYSANTGTWAGAERLVRAQYADAHDVVVESGGDASVVAFLMHNENRVVVYSRRFDWATGMWSALTEIPSQSLYHASSLQLATSGAGDAMVTWVEDEGYYAARYDAQAAAWQDATPFASNVGSALGPMLMHGHDNGDVTIAWLDQGAAFAARHVWQSDTWSTATRIDSVNPGVSADLRLSGAPSDGAVAIWTRNQQVWWSRYNSTAQAWEDPALLRNGPRAIEDLRFGMDAAGDALMTYKASDAKSFWLQRYDSTADSWQTPTLLAFPLPGRRGPVDLRVHDSGDAILGLSTDRAVRGAFYKGAGRELLPIEVLGRAPLSPFAVDMAFDGQGHAVFAWRQGTNAIWTHRYE